MVNRFPGETRKVSLLHNAQTALLQTQHPTWWVPWGSSVGVMNPEWKIDPWPPTNAVIKKKQRYNSIPPTWHRDVDRDRFTEFSNSIIFVCRFQWPRGLRRGSAAARLLGLWVRIPPGAWMFVCCQCCVLSGRGLYDELITCPEETVLCLSVIRNPR